MTAIASGRATLTIADVSVRFRGIKALTDVSLGFAAPICGLIGPNGAGKSTLLSVMTGFVAPDGGTVHIDGDELTHRGPADVARKGLTRTFQTSRLLEDESVFTNILFGRQPRTRAHVPAQVLGLPGFRRAEAADRQLARDMADRLGFGRVDLRRPVKELPFGLRRRVEVGRAFVSAPRAVLLDEPAAGLARNERLELADFVREYVADHDTIVIFTEHDVDLVRTLSDRVAVLDAGRLVAYGPPAEVLNDDAVRAAYFGRARA